MTIPATPKGIGRVVGRQSFPISSGQIQCGLIQCSIPYLMFMEHPTAEENAWLILFFFSNEPQLDARHRRLQMLVGIFPIRCTVDSISHLDFDGRLELEPSTFFESVRRLHAILCCFGCEMVMRFSLITASSAFDLDSLPISVDKNTISRGGMSSSSYENRETKPAQDTHHSPFQLSK